MIRRAHLSAPNCLAFREAGEIVERHEKKVNQSEAWTTAGRAIAWRRRATGRFAISKAIKAPVREVKWQREQVVAACLAVVRARSLPSDGQTGRSGLNPAMAAVERQRAVTAQGRPAADRLLDSMWELG